MMFSMMRQARLAISQHHEHETYRPTNDHGAVASRNRRRTRQARNEMTRVYEKRCPHCSGDVLFALRLEGPSLKCLQCTRSIDKAQARLMLSHSIQRTAAA